MKVRILLVAFFAFISAVIVPVKSAAALPQFARRYI
jgi:hypothetical protein